MREGKATSSLVAKWAPSPASATLRPSCLPHPVCFAADSALDPLHSVYSSGRKKAAQGRMHGCASLALQFGTQGLRYIASLATSP